MDRWFARGALFLFLCSWAFAPTAPAQKTSVIPLVTTPTWRLVHSETLDLSAVRDWHGDPAIEKEYGVKNVVRRAYRLKDTLAEAVFETASDATTAYGLYTFYQTDSMKPEPGMQLVTSGREGALMARGRFFIRVFRPPAQSQAVSGERKGRAHRASDSSLSESDFRALLTSIGGAQPSRDALASLPAPLPAAGLVKGSERYLLGPEAARKVLPAFPIDLIGFSQGAEAQAATYASGRTQVKVLAITYPTPQIARIRFGAMERFLGINQEHGPGTLYGNRQGSFVFLVMGAESAQAANRIMEPFRVSQSVSWHERYPGDESIWLQVVKLVLFCLALVGILCGLAILGGVMIFISRRIAAKWFPESSWGHPDEGSFIRLNLS